jgi:hypothetical protein
MYRGDRTEARIVSFGIGGGVGFIFGPLLALAFGDSWLIYLFLAFAYVIAAAAVALIWPQLGWRTGLWFFAFFPPFVLFTFLFTLDVVPISWRDLTGILAYSPSFLGACLGGWIGSTLRRRRQTAKPPNQTVPTSLPTH